MGSLENIKFKGAKVSKIDSANDLDLLKISIFDHAEWKDNLSQLEPYFGSMIFEEYEGEPLDLSNKDHLKRLDHQLDLTFSDADSVYFLTNREEIIGYSAIFHYQEDKSIGILLDIVIDKNYRGKGYAAFLYRPVFAYENLFSLIGITKTPQAVIARTKSGKEFGFITFYADQNPTRADIKATQEAFLNYYAELISDIKAPDGFLFLKGEENVLPQLKREQVKFDPSDPLNRTFEKLLSIQASHPKDTAVGYLISVKAN